ncbi:hypothetical protein [Rhodococcus sp. 1168]|uniref:hypothetical protein n=1 Tax=Rhodococcus sp. 1168 TaxID=2018041 RepID=UPI000F736082|nr:hypothetical protein [Rhodococcus sp. 1168]
MSDYSGDELPDDTKPTKITIQPAGTAAKDATTLELYMSESELAELVDNIEKGQPIIPRSQPASRPASRIASSNAQTVPAKQKEAWAKFAELKPEGKTNAEFASMLEDWLKENPVKKLRGGGSYDKIQPTERGIAAPVIEAYAAAQ